METTKVLMVCLGNICRSPLAQGIFEAKTKGLPFQVDSAGTSGYHIGSAPDPRSCAVALRFGIDLSTQKARKFEVSDFGVFDYIFVMDKSNYNAVLALASSKEEQEKVHLFLPNGKEVPDPYYGGDEGFEHCYALLNKAADHWINTLNHE
ncbi:MAG: low molecular weight phosphotyrosine protein phosphatase [Flavobacteriia bacterium]|nr:low molecular weight phosphotyrosine protein phosphatase [Flavobacteriia bacterium]